MSHIRPLPMCTCGKAPSYKDDLCIGCYSIQTAKAVIEKQGICQNCDKPVYKRQRCRACYEYLIDNGTERQRVVRYTDGICQNCGDKTTKSLGRCNACCQYFYSHGVERPQKLIERQKARLIRKQRKLSAFCWNCKNETGTQRTECEACRRYRSKRGVLRPSIFWTKKLPNRERFCQNCGRRGVHGLERCDACYFWTRTKGIERPLKQGLVQHDT